MAFDIEGARRAGYSEGEIADFLAQENRFDAGAARQSGYSDAEIVQHLAGGAPQPEAPGIVGRAGRFADNVVRQVAQGATAGFMDEAAASLNTGSLAGANRGLWGDYNEALAAERARDAEFRRNHPYVSMAANVAGGVMSPLGRLGIFNPGRAASLPGAVARGSLAGATGGALAGFGEGEGGVTERAGAALVGGGVGAVLGGALPLAVEGGRAAANAVGRRVGLTSGAQDAERIVLRNLQRDGVTPEDLLARVQESNAAGRPEVLADLAGENTRGAAAAVARAPGAGREAASRLVAERGGQAQGERLAGEVRRAVSGDDFRVETDALIQQRSAQARPLYERAFSQRVPRTVVDALEPITSSRNGQAALSRGLNVLEEEGRAAYLQSVREGAPNPALLFDPQSVGAVRGENGQWVIQGRMESLRLLDAVKRGLDELSAENVNPQTGRPTQLGLQFENQRRELVGYLRDKFPRYAQALDAWAGPSALMDAMRLGRNVLSDGPDAAERSAREIARLSPSEREFFRTGVARGLMDRIGRAVDGAEQTRINQMIGSPQVRERLRAAFDSDEEFNAFRRALEAEARMAATNRAVNPQAGSQTAPLQMAMDDLRSPPASGLVVDASRREAAGAVTPAMIRSGVTGGISGPLFQGLERMQQAAQQSRLERNIDALTPMLFGRDPAAREQMARQLMARALADQRTQEVVNPRIRALARGLAVGGSIEAND